MGPHLPWVLQNENPSDKNEILNALCNPTSPPIARAQHSAKMVPTWSQKLPKSSEDGAQRPQNGAKMRPRWGQDGEQITNKYKHNKKVRPLNLGPPIWTENVANMTPTWFPK